MGLFENIANLFRTKETEDKPINEASNKSLNESFGVSIDSTHSAGFGSFDSNFDTFGDFFFDNRFENTGVFNNLYGDVNHQEIEKTYIIRQRYTANIADVSVGIGEIVRDLYLRSKPIDIEILTNKSNTESLFEVGILHDIFAEFSKNIVHINDRSNIPNDLLFMNLVRQIYIDGVCFMMVVKEENDVKFSPLDPVRVSIFEDKITYNDYYDEYEISPENLIIVDFGLRDPVGARYGYLSRVYKVANQLEAMQDMLIQMRYRRSVSRRIFNVDVSALNPKRATEYMNNLKREFKYDKEYDKESGRIVSTSNRLRENITEDYWFSNRSGSKGVEVDLMEEVRALSDDIEDIKYFNKKLYQAMSVPLRRVFESEAEFDYTQQNIEQDELKFNNFLTELRALYNSLLSQMFKIYYDHAVEKIIAQMKAELQKNLEDLPPVETPEESEKSEDGSEEEKAKGKKKKGKKKKVEESVGSETLQKYLSTWKYFRENRPPITPRFGLNDGSYGLFERGFGMDDEEEESTEEKKEEEKKPPEPPTPEELAEALENLEFKVYLNYDNWFEINKARSQLEESMGMWEEASKLIGKVYSAETVIRKVFNMTESDFLEERKRMEIEKGEHSHFNELYPKEGEDDGGGW